MSARFAVVGCGNAARHLHLPALRAAGVEVVVFASRSRASAEAARDQWGSGAVADRWQDALTRDDVDGVVVATPNGVHREVAVAAAAAGKHVLVDKPMACTTADVDEMIAAADASGVVLVPFHNTRFAAPFVAARDLVAAGRLGSLTGIRAAFGHAGPQVWAPHADWFFDRSVAGGGCLIDLGVHIIDVVRHVTGDDIVAVAGLLDGAAGVENSDVETDAQLLVRLRGGAIGSIHASWSSKSGPDQQLTVVGDRGTLHLDTRTLLTFLPADGERERIAVPDTTSTPLAELLAAMRGERPPSVTAADGRAAVAVVETAYRSAEAGCTMLAVT
jgi:UDP-N-acetylglucosamine 3-dehydrogenase